MYTIQGGNGRHVRSLFISDVHLGCKYARVDGLLKLLHTNAPDRIYLVGDIIDGWRLTNSPMRRAKISITASRKALDRNSEASS